MSTGRLVATSIISPHPSARQRRDEIDRRGIHHCKSSNSKSMGLAEVMASRASPISRNMRSRVGLESLAVDLALFAFHQHRKLDKPSWYLRGEYLDDRVSTGAAA